MTEALDLFVILSALAGGVFLIGVAVIGILSVARIAERWTSRLFK